MLEEIVYEHIKRTDEILIGHTFKDRYVGEIDVLAIYRDKHGSIISATAYEVKSTHCDKNRNRAREQLHKISKYLHYSMGGHIKVNTIYIAEDHVERMYF